MRLAQIISRGALALATLSIAGQAIAAERVTSNFGYRKDPFHGGSKFHAGMDFGAATGTPVYATGDGYIRRARWAGGYGNLVEVEHGFGYQSRFGHLSKILVGEGQFVKRGQMIGLVGSTGRSTGPHLHYEVRINGQPQQPANFLQIVFSQTPDWRGVQASLAGATPTYRAPGQASTVALARTTPKAEQQPRISGDIDLELADTSVSMGGAAKPSNSFGYVAGIRRP